MSKNTELVFLIFLFLVLFAINYSWLDEKVENFLNYKEEVIVTRIIDGDTIVAGNETIRLLGINTPEKGEKYYSEAKEFLEELTLNQSIKIEKTREDKDKYYRSLRYVFLNNINVNKLLIENGYANPYFFEKDKYYDEFHNAWNNCLSKEINLCEKSKDKCAECIILKEVNEKNDFIVFFNQCGFECDLTGWNLKGEGRKFVEINEKVISYEELIINIENISDVFSIFLRDEENKLVGYWD